MQQSGEVPEPEHPAAQSSPLPSPARTGAEPDPVDPGAVDDEPGPPDRRGFLVIAIVALVAVLGVAAWAARPDDGLAEVDRDEARFPTPTTLAPPTTLPAPTSSIAVPTTTPATPVATPVVTPVPTPPPTATPATPAPTPAPPPTPAPTPAPSPPPTSAAGAVPPGPTGPGTTAVSLPPDDPDEIARLVPSVAAFTEYLSTPELVTAQVDQLLAAGRHDIATPGPVASICAVVPMSQPLAVRGRWERDGRRVASGELDRRDAPGFGECLTNDGDPLEDGSYQFIGSDSNGHESAAGGIVVGAARLDQQFANDGAGTICAVRIAPSSSRYFEVYVYDAQPIVPGATITLAVADVDQDVETVDCADEGLDSFSFRPAVGGVQSLAP